MLKSQSYTFKGIDRDSSKSKRDNGFYWDMVNKRIVMSEDSFENGNVVDEQGMLLFLTIPDIYVERNSAKPGQIRFTDPYTNIEKFRDLSSKDFILTPGFNAIYRNHTVLNISTISNKLVIFTYSPGSIDLGFIFVITYNEDSGTYSFDISFFDTIEHLNWDLEHPIQTISNKENENIEKIYFIDGKNQLRYINILDDNFDYSMNRIESLPYAPYKEIELLSFSSGGFYKAGVVQYAYNFYNIHGSQTKISPITPIIYLGDNLKSTPKGLSVNEYSSSSVDIKITDINTEFDRIKIYALYRSTLNQIPEIRVIYDDYINSSELQFTDTGANVVNIITYDSFLYIGGELIIPNTFKDKDNYLFLANYKFEQIKFPEWLDLRCVQFDSRSKFKVCDTNGDLTSEYSSVNDIETIDSLHDFINPDYYHTDGIYNPISNNKGYNDINDCKYKYQSNGTTLGGEGKYIKYSFETKERIYDSRLPVQSTTKKPLEALIINTESIAAKVNAYEYISVKTGETYRLAIEARDKYGRTTEAKWFADIKVPEFQDLYNETSNSSKLPFGKLFPSCSDSNYATKIQSVYVKIELKIEDIISAFEQNGINIVGFKILRAIRNNDDKSIIGQGLLNTSLYNQSAYEGRSIKASLDYFQRYRVNKDSYTDKDYNFSKAATWGTEVLPIQAYKHNKSLKVGYSNEIITNPDGTQNFDINSSYISIMSPDFIDEKNVSSDDFIFSLYTMQLYETSYVLKREHLSNKTIANTSFIDSFQTGYGYNSGLSSDPTKGNFLGRVIGMIGSNYIIDSTASGLPYDEYDYYTAYSQAYTGYNKDDAQSGINIVSSEYPVKISTESIEWFNGVDSKPMNILKGEWYKPCVSIGFLSTRGYSVSLQTKGMPHIAALLNMNNNVNPYILSNEYTESGFTSVNLGDSSNVKSFDAELENAKIYGTICEVRKKIKSQYGGFNYNQKIKSTYIPFSLLIPVEDAVSNVLTINCTRGDTFVSVYRNLRYYSESDTAHNYIHEIISFPVESYINLELRNDNAFSRSEFFLSTFDDSFKYNTIYSQEDNILTNTGLLDYQYNNSFNCNIMPTKKKIYGAIIDGWTDVLISEEYSLSGTYDDIESLALYNNELFALQRNAICRLIINPRVVIPTSDGIPIELSSGIASGNPTIQQHIYIDIKSGCQNKFSVQVVDAGIIYVDLYKKSIMLNSGGESINLSLVSSVLSMHKQLIDYNIHSKYHHVLDNHKGISVFYDNLLKEINISLFGGDSNITLVYSFITKTFTHSLTYTPTFYCMFINSIIVVNPGENKKWHLYKLRESDNVCVFFHDDTTLTQLPHNSSITLLAAPDVMIDKLFTNAVYEMETQMFNGQDNITKTFDKVIAWNEYQEGVLTDLIIGKNINRKYRVWKCQIPRMKPNTKNKGVRIGSNWIFLKFINLNIFDYPSSLPIYNNKTILHNMNIIYSI